MQKSLYSFRNLCLPLLLALAALACNLGGASTGGQPADTSSSPSETPASQPAATQPPAAPVQPGDQKGSFTSGGIERTYILHVPAGYDGSKSLPLVFVLHGMGGSADGMLQSTGLNPKADQESFFVVYLNGTGNPQGWSTGLILRDDLVADDLTYIHELLQHLETQLNVDSQRVYAAGFSNGAMMTELLGAKSSADLAGIAVIEGTIGVRQTDNTYLKIPEPIGPIPVLIFHGKKDPNLPYDGGQGIIAYALSVADAVAFWTKADGCNSSPSTRDLPGGNTVSDYNQCSANSEVMLVTLANGVHAWPSLNGPAKLAAADVVWNFFSRHSKP